MIGRGAHKHISFFGRMLWTHGTPSPPPKVSVTRHAVGGEIMSIQGISHITFVVKNLRTFYFLFFLMIVGGVSSAKEVAVFTTESSFIKINDSDGTVIETKPLKYPNPIGILKKPMAYDARKKNFYATVIDGSSAEIISFDWTLSNELKVIDSELIVEDDELPYISVPPTGKSIYVLKVDGSGNEIATKYNDGSRELAPTFPKKGSYLGFSSDGSKIFSVEYVPEPSLVEHNAATLKILKKTPLNIDSGKPWEVKLFQSGQLVISTSTSADLTDASSEEVLTIYDLESNLLRPQIRTKSSEVTTVALTPDKKKLLLADATVKIVDKDMRIYETVSKGTVSIYDTSNATLLRKIDFGTSSGVTVLGVNKASTKAYFLSTEIDSEQYKITIIDLNNYRVINEIKNLDYGTQLFFTDQQ
jgi:DNA-binding beta-propeller fold protein YncE